MYFLVSALTILIVTLSAIITPPDVFSQVLVALPLMVLYEIGISISKRIMRQQEAAEAEREEEYRRSRKKKPSKAQEPKQSETERSPGYEQHEQETSKEAADKEAADEEAKDAVGETDKKEDISSKKPWKQPDTEEGRSKDEGDDAEEDEKTE